MFLNSLLLLGFLPFLCHSLAYNGKDYPPIADPGPDVVLHLPHNYVTLNGSNSRDDHGNLTYLWAKVGYGLSGDMAGVRSPVLYVSGLQQGDYTFVLSVTDTAGQSSSKEVHVYVKSAVCETAHTHHFEYYRGVIDSSRYEFSTCLEWAITAEVATNITLSFSEISLGIGYSYNCEGDNHIELGPLPLRTICSSYTNEVYISQRNHVWIKLVRGSSAFDKERHFKVRYIASPPCYENDFRCKNGRCIYNTWRCNGVNECGDWSDESYCDEPVTHKKTTTTTTTKVTTPRPTSSPSCATVHCYVSRFGIYDCIAQHEICDGVKQCADGSDEYSCGSDTWLSNCNYDEIKCVYDGYSHCLPSRFKCDGIRHCDHGEDEREYLCGERSCNRRLEGYTGWFASPNFPAEYPTKVNCSWEIHVLGEKSPIHIKFIAFHLHKDRDTGYVQVYDGADETYPLLGQYDGNNLPHGVITSTQSWVFVKFVSKKAYRQFDDIYSMDGASNFIGFNATYQVRGYCLAGQLPCMDVTGSCYDKSKGCDGYWDCPDGQDETNCHNCKNGYFSCGPGTLQCYTVSERCNGMTKCSSNADEENCNAVQCGSHNGTFLCENGRCIYETWTCDERDDCGDYSDEKDCSGSSRRVIIAAISGSVICALLLTILIGCSCKLYSLRTIERHGGIRHHSPMSRLYAEFLRRTAPPPYHEAMLTSRNYDEVQQERRERMRSLRRGRRRNGQGHSSQNNTGTTDANQNGENPTNTDTGAQENLTFINELEVNETNDNANIAQNTTENTGLILDRSNEASEGQNTDSDSDTDSSNDQDGNGINQDTVNTPGDIEMQSTGLSSGVSNLDDNSESSDDSCILNHQYDCDETSQNLDNQSISLDDISMETVSASINLELTEISEDTNLENHQNREGEESDKDLDCEQENEINTHRSLEPKDEENEVISSGCGGRRNSQESLNSLHSTGTADSDEPLLVA